MSGTEAAAALPPIVETNEVWAEDEAVETTDTEGEQSEPPVAGTVAADEEETPAAVENEAETEDLTALREKAASMDSLTEAFTRNPKGYAQFILDNLPPAERAALMQQVAPPTPPVDPTADWGDAELLQPSERYLKSKAHLIEDLPRWAGSVQDTQQTLYKGMMQHDNELAEVKAQLAAVLEVVGIKAPVSKAGADSKSRADYQTAVKAEAAKIVAANAAKAAPVPRSVRQSAGGGEPVVEVKDGDSFASIFRRAKAASLR